MAGRGTRKKPATARPGAKRATPRRSTPPASVLGNDPFVRGAAPRAPVTQLEVPLAPPAPAAASAAPAAPPPEPRAAAEAAPAVRGSAPGPQPSSPPATPPARFAPPAAPLDVATVRSRLSTLESRVEAVAAAALGAAERLADLARQEATGTAARDLLRMLSGLLPAIRERLVGLSALRTFFAGPGELDFFGMDREFAERARPVLDFLYDAWWRVETREIENVPTEGPVIVVANHGGALPWDALVLRLALARAHSAHRDLRPLLDESTLKVPVAGAIAARLGAVPATPENALRLLEAGRVLAVFPEGRSAATRPWPERYHVQRFGRGGFTKLALRTGARIVPCAIVGSEETSAPFARTGWLSERLEMPFTFPALPLSAVALLPLPSRWSLRFGPAIDPGGPAGTAAQDPAHVLEVTERVRESLQRMLDEDVAARRSVYL